jgi:2OG-Fe(II) oxygenase superfamily
LGPALPEYNSLDVLVIDSALDEPTCRKLLETVERQLWEPSSADHGRPTRSIAPTGFDLGMLYRRIHRLLPRKIGGMHLCDLASERQIMLRYGVGDFFAAHTDSPYVRDRYTESKFSCVVYLNDDYVGGQTYFPRLDKRVEPRPGRAVLIPHSEVHQGLSIQSGIKHALHSYLMYRISKTSIKYWWSRA